MQKTLTSVRLSFPSIFKGRAFEEGDEPRFSATALISVDDAQLEALKNDLNKFAREHFDAKELKSVKFCLRPGDEKSDLEGYGPEVMSLNASSKKRPSVVDRTLSPLVEEDNIVYAGCYVNMAVRFWAQNNKWGKRVNAELKGVQFVKEGEAFGEAPFDPTSAFTSLDEGGEDVGGENLESLL